MRKILLPNGTKLDVLNHGCHVPLIIFEKVNYVKPDIYTHTESEKDIHKH